MRIEFQFVMASLAVWRLTHLLNAEDGPWRMLARLRKVVGVGFWGDLMDCFYCLSLWIAVPFAVWLGGGWTQWLLSWLAISGAAILLERATTPVQPAWFEDSPRAVIKGEDT
jgi:O-antigen ligase